MAGVRTRLRERQHAEWAREVQALEQQQCIADAPPYAVRLAADEPPSAETQALAALSERSSSAPSPAPATGLSAQQLAQLRRPPQLLQRQAHWQPMGQLIEQRLPALSPAARALARVSARAAARLHRGAYRLVAPRGLCLREGDGDGDHRPTAARMRHPARRLLRGGG